MAVWVLKIGDTETIAVNTGRERNSDLDVAVARPAPLTRQTVVEMKRVSVMREVVLAEVGQFVMVDGQAVMVATRVDRTVEVV